MTTSPIGDVLVAAYRSWSETGAASVPDFAPADYDRAELDALLSDLEAVSSRCVVSKTQATWLRQAIA